jgi:hypothetical protein
MRDKSSIRPLKLSQPPTQPRTPKINRNIDLIEFLVSHRKQRPNKKSIATFPAHPALQESSPGPHATNPTPSQIYRHTFLLEFAVSHRKQSSIKILIETKTTVFPPRQKRLPTPQSRPSSPSFRSFPSSTSSASSTSFTSFGSYLTRLCVTISGGEAPCRT